MVEIHPNKEDMLLIENNLINKLYNFKTKTSKYRMIYSAQGVYKLYKGKWMQQFISCDRPISITLPNSNSSTAMCVNRSISLSQVTFQMPPQHTHYDIEETEYKLSPNALTSCIVKRDRTSHRIIEMYFNVPNDCMENKFVLDDISKFIKYA